MIAVTGASGQLGRHVIHYLRQRTAAGNILALTRNPTDIQHLRQLGVQVRHCDFNQPDSLQPAFSDAEKILLIPGNEIGMRIKQERAVINAAQCHQPDLFVYVSVTRATTTPIALAQEHKATEQNLGESDLNHVILRNCWYNENLTQNLTGVLASGRVRGTSANGLIHTAAAKDYAEAAAVVLTSSNRHAGKVYELAGDEGFTMEQYAAEVERLSGKTIHYENMKAVEFCDYLQNLRMPQQQAELLTDAQIHAREGWLKEGSQTLKQLIGRPTTNIAESIKDAL